MIRFAELERHGLRVAAMTDRADGNMKLDDDPDETIDRRTRAFECLGLQLKSAVFCNQVHGTRIHTATEADIARGAFDVKTAVAGTDGLITADAGVPLAIQIADCVPIFLFDRVQRVCGLLHAGRVGTVAGIARAGVESMCGAFGCKARDIQAQLGPSAGPTAYQVSGDVLTEAERAGLSINGDCIDLWASNARQLSEAGLSPGKICQSGICTISDGGFFSYRRGDILARNLAVVSL